MVLRPELGEGVPVAQPQLRAVADAVAALQRSAGKPESAEALLGERAHVLGDVAVEQQYASTSFEQLDRRADAGNAGADHDHFGLELLHARDTDDVRACWRLTQAPSWNIPIADVYEDLPIRGLLLQQ